MQRATALCVMTPSGAGLQHAPLLAVGAAHACGGGLLPTPTSILDVGGAFPPSPTDAGGDDDEGSMGFLVAGSPGSQSCCMGESVGHPLVAA